MTVIVNGEARQIPENTNLAQLLEILELPSVRVAIELNQNVIRRVEWGNTVLQENDRIEIVHFVGGG
ncbi:MAG: sulfur carrier protein ThiS [Acidobacteriota bacterium]|nr:sulfur carrier protein ThiS [Acidobacteriota bacterium]